MSGKKFELIDPATGKKSELQTLSGTLGPDVLNIAPLAKDHGVFTFDPGYMVTASCESRITYIDGEQGVLLYRGYPVEQLAERSSFLEVAYLLLLGDLPTPKQLTEFSNSIRYHTMINEALLRFFNGFHRPRGSRPASRSGGSRCAGSRSRQRRGSAAGGRRGVRRRPVA